MAVILFLILLCLNLTPTECSSKYYNVRFSKYLNSVQCPQPLLFRSRTLRTAAPLWPPALDCSPSLRRSTAGLSVARSPTAGTISMIQVLPKFYIFFSVQTLIPGGKLCFLLDSCEEKVVGNQDCQLSEETFLRLKLFVTDRSLCESLCLKTPSCRLFSSFIISYLLG